MFRVRNSRDVSIMTEEPQKIDILLEMFYRDYREVKNVYDNITFLCS